MRRLSVLRMLAASALCFVLAGTAGATVLLDETNLVALPTVAAPSEFAFTTTTAQALTVTLTDLQAPAAFQSLQIAVTLGDTVVGSVSVDATSHTAALTLPAAIGNYVLHVIGTPDATQNFGGFGACVAPTASPTSCIAADSFAGTLATPAPPSTNPASQVDTNFTSTTAGTYTVTVTDDAFPVALQRLSGGLASGSTPITQLGLGTTPVTLAAGTSYTLILGAVADATVKAGLYGVHITDPSGAAVFDRTLPVGGLGASTVVKSSSAQSLNLTLSDLQYPAALATVGAAVTAGGSPALAELTAGGSVAVAAPAGSLEVWTFASATAAPGVYSLSLASTTASLLSTTQVVNPGSDSAPGSYAFLVTLPAAGTYQLSTTDFQFPATLQSLSATIAQNGTVLTQSETGVFTAAAGTAVVLVNAQPPTTGNGIFAVTVQTTATPATIVLDQTQAVGGVFDTRAITVGQAGDYNVTLTDLEFPTSFANLAVVVSQGSQIIGKIYGGGTFAFNVTSGTYVLTFVATPSTTAALPANDNYGLYAVNITSAAPTITFTGSPTSIAAGAAVQLTWSTQDATACTAAGASGWSGTEPTSGTAGVVLTATSTLTLTCTGPGGSSTQSVPVTVTAAPAKSGGGGGAIDLACLTLLTLLTAMRLSSARGGPKRIGRL